MAPIITSIEDALEAVEKGREDPKFNSHPVLKFLREKGSELEKEQLLKLQNAALQAKRNLLPTSELFKELSYIANWVGNHLRGRDITTKVPIFLRDNQQRY